jgi:hypothetical protein
MLISAWETVETAWAHTTHNSAPKLELNKTACDLYCATTLITEIAYSELWIKEEAYLNIKHKERPPLSMEVWRNLGMPNNAGTCKHHRKRDNMQFLMTINCVYGMNLWCMFVEMGYQ